MKWWEYILWGVWLLLVGSLLPLIMYTAEQIGVAVREGREAEERKARESKPHQ